MENQAVQGKTSFFGIGVLAVSLLMVLMGDMGTKAFGTMGMLFGLYRIYAVRQGADNAKAQNPMLALPYHHTAYYTAIAIDPARREIHLAMNDVYKVYPFADVRKWTTNMQTGGLNYGGGLAGLAANANTSRSNRENSGLFIEVRDIDYPLWKIRFKARSGADYEMQLARWMEILRQHINES